MKSAWMALLAFVVASACTLPQRCINDDNCPDDKVCRDELCVAGEEGEGEEGEGEEGEGEEGEGEEGEGEEGEGEEGEGEFACGDPVVACGNNITDIGEQCDNGDTIGGDGCSAGCRFEVEQCGINIPSDLEGVGAVAGAGVIDNAPMGCFSSISAALAASGDSLLIAPGTYGFETWPLSIDRPVFGMGQSQVVLTAATGLLTLTNNATLAYLTVQSPSDRAIVATSGEVTLLGVKLIGTGSNELLVADGFAQLSLLSSIIVNAQVVSQDSDTNIIIRDSAFQNSSLLLSGALSAAIENNCFDIGDGSEAVFDMNEGIVSFAGNDIGGDPCTDNARAVQLQTGTFVLADNHFASRPNCTAIEATGNAVQFRAGNVFDASPQGEPQLDLVVDNITVTGGVTVDWSNDGTPCNNIQTRNSGSVEGVCP